MLGYLILRTSRILRKIQYVKFTYGKYQISNAKVLLDKGVPKSTELPLDGTSASYLEDMYNNWLKDPKSVHSSWDSYFRHSQEGGTGYMQPPNLSPSNTLAYMQKTTPGKSQPQISAAAAATPQTVQDHMNVQAIIKSFQVRGHLAAKLNPLDTMFDITNKTSSYSEVFGGKPPEKLIRNLKIDSLMDSTFQLPSSTMIGGGNPQLTLREIIKKLELIYCRHIGVEYMHLNSEEQRQWLREKFEAPGVSELKKPEKRLILTRLAKAVLYEQFLQKKWSSEKRFGLEGCEILIPCIKTVIETLAEGGSEMAVIGMAHRGRLNVLANICHKPLHLIFGQFRGLEAEDKGAGDVKYHLGVFNKRDHPRTKKPFITVLVANPSHLEMVNPVCAGRTKAEQFQRKDATGDKVFSIIVHGDAAICGEGVVYESINLANVNNFKNGGTIHFVINNQVGFTTNPPQSRSSFYCSDVGRFIEAPIFHVNGEDPESCVYVAKVAAEFRAKFHKDVIIDLVAYRKHGHNETDEPMFTQPEMYKKIRQMPDIFKKYSAAAMKTGVATEAEVNSFKTDYEKKLEEEFVKASQQNKMRFSDWIDSPWPEFFKTKSKEIKPTSVGLDVLQHIAKKFSTIPPDFELHKALMRVFNIRQELVQKETADWALGEALAIGSLLKEGIHVRFSGQDVERGTFSHRHHVIHHQNKENFSYTFLKDLYPDQAPYVVTNGPISEYAVLGFEHGYSMARPDYLVIWEAQFGDFANNAQAMFDCMIASGETKWIRQCGMVVLLPHGLEGQGPEHSSARVERYLQLSSDDPDYFPEDLSYFESKQLEDVNWIIANCTTPANLFHIIRRQIKLPFRKPLLIVTPKSLLRHPEARSTFKDMAEGSTFQRIIPETGVAAQNPGAVKKLIFCTGKVYFEIKNFVKEKKLEEKIAVARVEQICPFPFDLVQKETKKYGKAQIVWAQEEHKNSGCWTYIEPRMETALKGERDIIYIGRAPSSSTASGNKIQYQKEYQSLMDDIIKNCE